MDNKRGKYAIEFGDIDKPQPYPGISFGYWERDPNEYNYYKEEQNLKRDLNLPSIEFLNVGSQRYKKIGQEFTNFNGSNVEIIEYIKNKDVYCNITTTQLNGNIHHYLKNSRFGNITRGEIKSLYDRSICKTAYVGYGKYNRQDYTEYYTYFTSMIERAFSPRFKEKNPEYMDVTADLHWLNFQNFATWCDENYYSIPGEKLCLDKDILIKNNRIYGPGRCVFVPGRINNLFLRNKSIRTDLPIGVTRCYDCEGYTATMSICIDKKECKYIGYFRDPIDAFYAYKEAKEKEIKRVADLYRQWIPEYLYYRMYNYEVEITD